jgi:hypothetical protein
MPSYKLPTVLEGKCSQKDYLHWLQVKAVAHVKRDKKRGNLSVATKSYRDAIHKAVCDGGDLDAYTGRPLRWDLIRKYDNAESKAGKRLYKKKFADLPTVDHQDDGMREPSFKICAWQTNDCKNDLSIEDLIKFCKTILEFESARSKNFGSIS